MEERGIRRVLPFVLPVVLLLALLSATPSGASSVGAVVTTVGTTPPTTAKPPPTTVAPAPTTTAAPPTTTAPAPRPSVAPTPAAKPPRPAPPPAPPPVPHGRGTWAVIVGVDSYPGKDLQFAEADARDVADALTGLGVPPSQINLLTGRAATGPALRGALDWLVANAGPDALAVVFFAGHVAKQARHTEELRVADNGRLSDAQLAASLARLQARRAWIAVAGCHGGGFTEVLAPGRILTGAAAENEEAYETTTYNRSYLVQFMIREAIIERRTAPTVQDAFAYAAARPNAEHRPVQYEMAAPLLDLRG